MRTIETTLYQFDELDDAAKERARKWYRTTGPIATWDDWYDCVFDSAICAGKIIGIEIDTRSVNLINGATASEPKIYFSGFYNQGDGACFEGRYEYNRGASKAIRAEFPTATELHRIADWLQAIQSKHFYQLSARITNSGSRYSHSKTMDIEVLKNDLYCKDECLDIDTQNEIAQLMRNFADWIYSSLESEYNYQNSDEQVDESIRANEYEFTKQGEIA